MLSVSLCSCAFYVSTHLISTSTLQSALCEGEGSTCNFNVALYHKANRHVIQAMNDAPVESWHTAQCPVLISHGAQESTAHTARVMTAR